MTPLSLNCTVCDKTTCNPINLNMHNIPQHDGNISLLSSLTDDSSNVCTCSEASLCASNLSGFLPFANYDISYDDISDHDSFYTQGSLTQSDLNTDHLPSPDPTSSHPTTTKKTKAAKALPNIMIANHRSIFPKFNSLIDELTECEMHIGLHSEIWEDKENVDHKNKVEEALELHGIEYISNPRPKRRGGGAAITLCDMRNQFLLTKLSINVPPDIEVCWGLLKIRAPVGPIKEIIICSFYCPPKSRKKTKLVEHISVNYFKLKSVHPKAAFICGGDKNDLNIKHLLDISPSFRQIVSKATHKHSVIDVIVTDIGHLYNEPVTRPALLPDIEGHGVPSDHKIVFSTPVTDSSTASKRSCLIKTSRPLTTEAKKCLAKWIQYESWSSVLECQSSSTMTATFTSLVHLKIGENVPLKTFKINNLDNDFTTPAIILIKRKKLREYTKHGNSKLYKILKKQVKTTIKSEGEKFISKQMELAGEKGNKWIRHTSSLCARPGDVSSKSFILPDHLERGLTELESAEEIADFFSKISQEYNPLNIDSLPDRVKTKLLSDPCDHLVFEEHEVYQELLSGKKTCNVPGDIPIDILNEFLPEFITPITAIFNCTFSTHQWPDIFKKEYGVPINKVPIPESADDLRSIGLTPFLSKRMEKLLIR